MTDDPSTPFESLESAHQYIALLCEALKGARADVEQDIASAAEGGAARRLEALQLVSYKLDRLEGHLESSRRLLNDLRLLKRVLVS